MVERREQMLRAALDVIVERGYADTRIADVAERTGTSHILPLCFGRESAFERNAVAKPRAKCYRTGERHTANRTLNSQRSCHGAHS